MLKYFLSIFIIPLCLFSQEKYTLSIAAIFQNEADYLEEWVSYHYRHGVEHFWLYNNNSVDDFHEALWKYIELDIVEIIEWPHNPQENDQHYFTYTIQCGAYNDALNRSRNVSKWLALIDTDEFIVTPDYDNISDLLETQYPYVSGLCANWQCYGTSYVQKAKSLIKELVWKMKWDHPWNKHSKSIVQPLHVSHCPNPHFCVYNYSHWAIDSNYNKCDMCCNSINIDTIRLNHYWTRDEWFLWNVKIPRVKQWGNDIEEILKHANRMNEEYDPIMFIYDKIHSKYNFSFLKN